MTKLKRIEPMDGCQVVTWDKHTILFGQPPEVLKSLIKYKLLNLDTLVLPDVRERSHILLNNLEFPLYYFLFVTKGLAQGRRLKLIGDRIHVSHVLKHLRLTLLGATHDEFLSWGTDDALRKDWENAIEFFALKDKNDQLITVSQFFDIVLFENDVADAGDFTLKRVGQDQFQVFAEKQSIAVQLDTKSDIINPPYKVIADQIPSSLVKFGIEVLGGASGFSPDEASTGLVLCFNGNYILIDSIPYVEHHLKARGISKNQISALFLTHIHDDHCVMFPLMLMPHRLEVISTREIFDMSMIKLAMGLGWTVDIVKQFFKFVEVKPYERFNYYGLTIDPHITVHSIPTVGVTFSMVYQGKRRTICVVGDNQSFKEIREMRSRGLLRQKTVDDLYNLYVRRFDLLVADGGEGMIHGDPSDALNSQSERVVFVHVDNLPERFNATFSLASSGKRYIIIEGDSYIYTTRIIEFLTNNFQRRLSQRWLGPLFADHSIRMYNTDDVIMNQGAEARGVAYLILTGYCEVIHHDGEKFTSLTWLQAGSFIGEMAVVQRQDLRNASVIARTPVTVCAFSGDMFGTFIEHQGLRDQLLSIWKRRTVLASLPQFSKLSSTEIDKICPLAEEMSLDCGETKQLNDDGDYWYIIVQGTAKTLTSSDANNTASQELIPGSEVGGYRPFDHPGELRITTEFGCTLVRFEKTRMTELIHQIPYLNYVLRKLRITQYQNDPNSPVNWLLGEVPMDQYTGPLDR